MMDNLLSNVVLRLSMTNEVKHFLFTRYLLRLLLFRQSDYLIGDKASIECTRNNKGKENSKCIIDIITL
jgi:hypothetical protein